MPGIANLQGVGATAVTASDSTVLGTAEEGGVTLFVGTGGNLTVDTVAGQTNIVFKNIPSGSFFPFRVTKVKAATTAADILAIK